MTSVTWWALHEASRFAWFKRLEPWQDAAAVAGVALLMGLVTVWLGWAPPQDPSTVVQGTIGLFVIRLLWVSYVDHRVEAAERRGEPNPLDALPRLPRERRH